MNYEPLGTYNSIFFIDGYKGWMIDNVGLMGQTENGGET